MGFWRTVLEDLRRNKWLLGTVLALGVLHELFVGLSVACLGWLLLIPSISKAFRKWCWRQPIAPGMLGFIAALASIFVIETYLGVSTWIFGAFDPTLGPVRKPTFLEGLLIWTLGHLYAVRPGQYIELVLAAVLTVTLIYAVLHIGRGRHQAKGKHKGRVAQCAELANKTLECASCFTLVLGTVVFANAVNLNAAGLNSFAVLYNKENRQLGANKSAINALQMQLSNLKETDDTVLREPPPDEVRKFLDGTAGLVDALWQLDQAKEETNRIERISYNPSEDPIPGLTVRLPPPVSEPGEPEIGMEVLLLLSDFSRLQREAEETQRNAEEIEKGRDDTLVRLSISISSVLERGRRLTPPEKARILAAIAQRLARLVARDGIERATEEVRELLEQSQRDAQTRQRDNNARRTEVEDFRRNLLDYMAQQKTCLDIANEVANFLRSNPDGSPLISKLNVYRGEIPRGVPLLRRPEWRSQNPHNQDLENQFVREISLQLYNRPNTPDGSLRDNAYIDAVRAAFQQRRGNVESPGFGLLLSWVSDACSRDQTSDSVIDVLHQRAQQPTPL